MVLTHSLSVNRRVCVSLCLYSTEEVCRPRERQRGRKHTATCFSKRKNFFHPTQSDGDVTEWVSKKKVGG